MNRRVTAVRRTCFHISILNPGFQGALPCPLQPLEAEWIRVIKLNEKSDGYKWYPGGA